MDINDVPQERNRTLSGEHKIVYARAKDGRVVAVASHGWEVEEIVTQQAVSICKEQVNVALVRAKTGQCSSLEYWMYEKRMNIATLAKSTGLWKWRVRLHLNSAHFCGLSYKLHSIYAEALGISTEQLKSLP